MRDDSAVRVTAAELTFTAITNAVRANPRPGHGRTLWRGSLHGKNDACVPYRYDRRHRVNLDFDSYVETAAKLRVRQSRPCGRYPWPGTCRWRNARIAFEVATDRPTSAGVKHDLGTLTRRDHPEPRRNALRTRPTNKPADDRARAERTGQTIWRASQLNLGHPHGCKNMAKAEPRTDPWARGEERILSAPML